MLSETNSLLITTSDTYIEAQYCKSSHAQHIFLQLYLSITHILKMKHSFIDIMNDFSHPNPKFRIQNQAKSKIKFHNILHVLSLITTQGSKHILMDRAESTQGTN